MTTFAAKVTQNIPANRLIGLGGVNTEGDPEEGWETVYLILSKKGWIPDLVSTADLEKGSVVNVKIKNNSVWKVESSEDLPAGTLVQCDDDGRVKHYRPEDGNHFGFTTHSVKAGEVVEVVRKYGYNPPTSQIESMSYEQPSVLDGTVSEVKARLDNLSKTELEKVSKEEKGNKNRKSVVEHIESLLEGK